jgi:hypothetical protein
VHRRTMLTPPLSIVWALGVFLEEKAKCERRARLDPLALRNCRHLHRIGGSCALAVPSGFSFAIVLYTLRAIGSICTILFL